MSVFNQPYPLWDNTPRKFYIATAISVFVFVFLYLFRPFGLHHIQENDILIFAGYGLVSFIALLLLEIALPPLLPSIFKEEKWKVYKEILFTLIIVSCIGTGNMLYSAWLSIVSVHINTWFFFQLVTLAIAVFPVTISILLKQNYLLKKNREQSNKLSAQLYRKARMGKPGGNTITLRSENMKDNITTDASDIYYLMAADNYIELHYKIEDKLKTVLLRSSLKNAHYTLKGFSNFYRCHRTYIVNLDKVQSVTGNSQGYRLLLFDTETPIPVSRTLNKEITQRLSI